MRIAPTIFPALLAATLSSQEPGAGVDDGFDILEQNVEFGLDASGRVTISPDPAAGGGVSDPAVLALGNDSVFQMWVGAGSIGLAAYLLPGREDVASLSDPLRFFERLGPIDHGTLFERIARPSGDGGSRAAELQRLLAVRLVQDQRIAAAIPALRAARDDRGAPAWLRRAAEEALAVIGDEPWPEEADVEPLAEVLATMPSDAALVIRIDQRRLPSARALLEIVRRVALETAKSDILRAGGSVSSSAWADACISADGPGILPYEFARVFGNARVDRTVVAVVAPNERPCFALSGEFDIAAIRAGANESGVRSVEGESGTMVFPIDRGYSIVAAPGRLTGAPTRPDQVLDHAAAEALAERLQGGGAIRVLRLTDAIALSELPAWNAREARIDLDVDALVVRATLVYEEAHGAAALREAITELVAGVGSDAEGTPELVPLRDLLAAIEVGVDGAEVSLTISLGGIDLEAALAAAMQWMR